MLERRRWQVRLADHASLRPYLAEGVTVAVITAATAGAYVWTKAPLYNPRGTIDPWLYTALWTNFGQVYHQFVHTYYAARVPWIVPGYVANLIFSPRTASLVVHTVFFFVGAAAVYVLCRRFVSWQSAAASYAMVVGSQVYFSAQRWDYEEGAVLTYAALAAVFVTTRASSSRAQDAGIALAGFFSAALVATQLLDAVLLLGLPLLYAAAQGKWRRVPVRRDIAAFAVGALVLIVACGIFARANGGRFLFFMPQVKVALTQSGEANQMSPDVWIPREPYFFVPPFLVVAAAVTWLVAAPSLTRRTRNFLIASTAWTALLYTLLCLWEFFGTGFFFEYVWYFSAFMLLFACVVAAISEAIAARVASSVAAVAIPLAVAVAALVPLLWVYKNDGLGRIAAGTTNTAYRDFTIAMIVALVLMAVSRIAAARAASLAALAAVVLAVSYGLDASLGTWYDGVSDPATGSLYDIGMQEIAFLRSHGFDEALPHFWYDRTAQPQGVLGSIQSLYYYSYTYVGVSMPLIDSDFRSRVKIFGNPASIVLLCTTPSCAGGPAALRKAGHPVRLASSTVLRSGSLRVWAFVYDGFAKGA